MKKTELVGIEPVQDIVELTLYTSYVKNEKPVSLIMVAEPESGKTELLKKYRKNNGVYATKRFSAWGIQNDLVEGKIKPIFEKPKILGHLIIYDFQALFSFKPSTVDSTIAFLDALTEEGLSAESDYATNYDALKPFEGLRGGIIAAINNEGFFTGSSMKFKKTIRKNMRKGGFFSRNVIVSYDISFGQLRRIFAGIVKGDYRTGKDFVGTIILKLPKKRMDTRISEDFAQRLVDLANDLSEDLLVNFGYRTKGIRLSKNLIVLAKASALRDKRNTVNEKDIERVEFLSRWMNLKFEKLRSRWYENA
jgi:hypothetical protein